MRLLCPHMPPPSRRHKNTTSTIDPLIGRCTGCMSCVSLSISAMAVNKWDPITTTFSTTPSFLIYLINDMFPNISFPLFQVISNMYDYPFIEYVMLYAIEQQGKNKRRLIVCCMMMDASSIGANTQKRGTIFSDLFFRLGLCWGW